MGVPHMVFLVIAFSAPLAASATQVPISLAAGNGIGAPGMWLVTGVILVIFSFGYATMSRRITNSGAFYAYITAGLGRRAGLGSGYVALIAYTAAVIYIGAFFGVFASELVASLTGITIHWLVLGVAGLLIVLVLAILGVRTSMRLLAVMIVLETALLLAINIGIFVQAGPQAYSLEVFNPVNVFAQPVGLTFAFVVATFLGFEATAIFGEEAKDPKRTVPRATILAVIIISVLYTVTAWSSVAALGIDNAVEAARAEPSTLFFTISANTLGAWSEILLNILVVTSLFAVLIAGHNAAARYVYSLGRDGWLPSKLGAVHRRFQTPHIAAYVQMAVSVIVLLAFGLAGADPFLELGATFVGLQVLGIMGLAVLVSVAVIVFFRRNKDSNATVWNSIIAPAISVVALLVACVALVANFGAITGSDSIVISLLPLLLLIAFVVGVIVAGRKKGAVDGEADSSPDRVPDRETT